MSQEDTYRPPYRGSEVPCIVCKAPLSFRLTKGRKSAKPSIMLICPNDGRHFRAFINDRDYVSRAIENLEARA